MAISQTIEFTSVDDLYLDPKNPRLGRNQAGPDVPQAQVLELMATWSLEKLGQSFVESGYWIQEALIIVREELYGEDRLVVVEGNRRLAALQLLRDAIGATPLVIRLAHGHGPK